MVPVLIIAIVFLSIITLTKMAQDHAARMKGSSAAENSLTTSELKTLVREAVDEANAGLEARLDRLEAKLDAADRRLPRGAGHPRELAGPSDDHTNPE